MKMVYEELGRFTGESCVDMEVNMGLGEAS